MRLLCLFYDILSVSTSWVLWCEPKTIGNKFFVLFRKCNKTIVNDIFKITTKIKITTTATTTTTTKMQLIILQFIVKERLSSINCYKNRTIYSQGYLYG